mgnify:CR=1 FL=1
MIPDLVMVLRSYGLAVLSVLKNDNSEIIREIIHLYEQTDLMLYILS